MTADHRLAARLSLVGSAALFSTGGAAIKACTLTGWQVASLRSAVAAFVLVALLPAARRIRDPRVWLVAVAYAGTLITFVRATKLTTAASAIFLQSAAPLYVMLLGPLLLRERVHRRDLGFMAAFALGLALLLSGTAAPLSTAPDPGQGNRLGILSGALWALTLVGLRAMARRDADAAVSAVAVGNVFASLAALPFALPLSHVGMADLLVIVYLGAIQIGLAYALLVRGMREVAALEASLILLVEPVLNPLWAWILHEELPEAIALVGGAVILGTTGLMAWRGGNRASREGNTRGNDVGGGRAVDPRGAAPP